MDLLGNNLSKKVEEMLDDIMKSSSAYVTIPSEFQVAISKMPCRNMAACAEGGREDSCGRCAAHQEALIELPSRAVGDAVQVALCMGLHSRLGADKDCWIRILDESLVMMVILASELPCAHA